MTDFSSYGPAIDLSFKPDIAAPGAVIVRRSRCPHRLLQLPMHAADAVQSPCSPPGYMVAHVC